MQLGDPGNLLLMALVEAIAIGFVWLSFWRRRAATRFAGERPLPPGWGAYWLRATLVVVAATLAVIAMARPQWGSREFSRQQEGIDLVIALDISQSMTAKDVEPSRLAIAQMELTRLLDSLRGNRIALIYFAGSPLLRSPLSTDSQAIADIIRRADKEPGLVRAGSDLGAALDQAGRLLDASDSPGKAVLLVSDGEDFGNVAAKATELGQKGIPVFTAGVGTPEGSTILEPVGGSGRPTTAPQTRVKLDANGRPVITRLDEARLQAVAQAGGGRYLHLGDSGSTLLSLRDDLNRLQQTPLSEQTQRVPIERLQLFAGAALIVLTLAWFVPDPLPRLRPYRRGLSPRLRPGLALILLAIAIGACRAEDPVRSRNQEANDLYAAGQFESALEVYQELLAQRPDLPEIAYNAGNSLHRLGRFDRAVEETRRALPPTTIELGAATYYALGNHFLAQNDLLNAFEAYKSALLLDPDDGDAKYNLELVLLRMNQPDQQPGQQPPAGAEQDGEPQPEGEGMDQPGQPQPGGAAGQPQQQTGNTGQPPQGDAADVRRSLEEALAGIDQELSFEEAVEILDLIRQLQEQPRQAPGQGPSLGPDY